MKHIYLEPINASKPRPFWSKTRFFWLPNVIFIYLVELLNSAQIMKHPLYLNDSWFLTLFGGGGKHHSSQKSNQKSNKAITVFFLFQFEAAQKNTPFFSRTKKPCLNFIFKARRTERRFTPYHTTGCFLKWWYPQISHFNWDFHYKLSILGYPYFWKHPLLHLAGCFSDFSKCSKSPVP